MTAQPMNLVGIDLRAEIDRLRKERNAVILAHYYQKPEIQDLADFVGDSLELSAARRRTTDADVIAFCGVRFMAETAKILSPRQDRRAARHGRRLQPGGQLPARAVRGVPRGASRSHRADLHQLLDRGEGAVATSSSPARRPRRSSARSRTDQKIIFGPDRNLGGYLNRKTGRDMLLWPGVCIVHEAFSETELLKLKAQHPGAPVAAHPECPPHILDHADYVGSTSGILQFAKTFPGDTLIVATEPHIIHQMEKAVPRQDLHRRARRGRQLQLQHLPVHGAQHDGEALRRAARPRAADRDRGRAAARAPRRASTRCSRWRAGRWAGRSGPVRVTGD